MSSRPSPDVSVHHVAKRIYVHNSCIIKSLSARRFCDARYSKSSNLILSKSVNNQNFYAVTNFGTTQISCNVGTQYYGVS